MSAPVMACPSCSGYGVKFDGIHGDARPCPRCSGIGESPLWPCSCGARNRLRDLVCRHCGDPNPMREDDDCDA